MIYRTFFGSPGRRSGAAFPDVEAMRRQMSRLFDAFNERSADRAAAGVYPAVNIAEDAHAIYISAELPGVSAADLDINVTANQLSLAGERKITSEATDVRYHRREREAGRFSRAIALPGDIDADKVKAKLTDGVLTVTVPKAEAARPRKISVK